MRSKYWSFALGILFLSGASVANAEGSALSIEGSGIRYISEKRPYNLREDMFSLSFALPKESVIFSQPQKQSRKETLEDTILAKWRAKQLEKWENLPQGKFVVNASAYTASADECGNSNGVTASGLRVQKQQTLACPPEFPFGAKVSIEGVGVLRCEDRGGAIKGNKFDIYMETKKEAFSFGRRNLVAEVVMD